MNWRGFEIEGTMPYRRHCSGIPGALKPQGTSVKITDDIIKTQSMHLLHTRLEHVQHLQYNLTM